MKDIIDISIAIAVIGITVGFYIDMEYNNSKIISFIARKFF